MGALRSWKGECPLSKEIKQDGHDVPEMLRDRLMKGSSDLTSPGQHQPEDELLWTGQSQNKL